MYPSLTGTDVMGYCTAIHSATCGLPDTQKMPVCRQYRGRMTCHQRVGRIIPRSFFELPSPLPYCYQIFGYLGLSLFEC